MKLALQLMILAALVFVIGCSSQGNPTTPSDEKQASENNNSYAPIVNSSVDGVTSMQGVYGAWKIHFDPKNLSAEIIPSRNSQKIGDIYDADLSQFLEVAPCANCLSIGKVFLDGYDKLNVEFRMKHPFSNIATRPDLHGFDVRGIFIGPADAANQYQSFTGIGVTKPDGSTEDALIASQFVLNADGYTAHFDELAADPKYFVGEKNIPGNLNPFLRFFESYTTPAFDYNNPVGQNVMKVGAPAYARTAILNVDLDNPNGFDLFFIADVAYGQSAVLKNRQTPQYYLPAFHRTEPWRVEYYIENNTLLPYQMASTADVIFQVFDWQQNATVDSNYPDPSNLSGVSESSKVKKVEFVVPDLQNGLMVKNTADSGTGTPTDPLVYKFTIQNSNNYGGYFTYGLVAIRDELDTLASPHGRQPIPSSPAGFPYPTLDIRDYSLYQIVNINLTTYEFEWENLTFGSRQLLVPREDLYGQQHKTIIHPTFFMDNAHKRFQYKWDYDYDGVTFDLDGSGLPSPEITMPDGGLKNVGLRVRTNSVPPQEYIYTLPVYYRGTGFHKLMLDAATTKDVPSDRSNHSMQATRDKFYFVYTHKGSGANNTLVRLAIVDRQGNVTTKTISDDLPGMVFYQPAMKLIDWGATTGIWVSMTWYDDVGDSQIWVARLDMDGNFVSGSRVSATASPNETSSLIFLSEGALHVYYLNNDGTGWKIFGAHSANWGSSWINDGWLADNGDATPNQSAPTIAIENYHDNTYLIWSENVNSATTGIDLYLAFSNYANSFDTPRKISITTDTTTENYPSASCTWQQLSIVYKSDPPGSVPSHVRLAVLNPANNYSIWDVPIQAYNGTEYTHYHPSISAPAYGTLSIAFAVNKSSTNETRTVVLQCYMGNMIGYLQETTIYDEICSTNPLLVYSYPCIVSYVPRSECVETFVVWRDAAAGTEDISTPSLWFGQNDMLYYVENQP